MPALEIWTNASGGVMLRDPTSGQCRELKDVQLVTFVDGSSFPVAKEQEESQPQVVRSLSGQVLRAG